MRRLTLWRPEVSSSLVLAHGADLRLHLWHPLAPRVWLPAGEHPAARVPAPYPGVGGPWVVVAHGGRLVGGPEDRLSRYLTEVQAPSHQETNHAEEERSDDWGF